MRQMRQKWAWILTQGLQKLIGSHLQKIPLSSLQVLGSQIKVIQGFRFNLWPYKSPVPSMTFFHFTYEVHLTAWSAFFFAPSNRILLIYWWDCLWSPYRRDVRLCCCWVSQYVAGTFAICLKNNCWLIIGVADVCLWNICSVPFSSCKCRITHFTLIPVFPGMMAYYMRQHQWTHSKSF